MIDAFISSQHTGTIILVLNETQAAPSIPVYNSAAFHLPRYIAAASYQNRPLTFRIVPLTPEYNPQ